MSGSPQIRSLTELAEAAAAVGDCASAARHLQSLARLQEAELGPAHPDLANTLNNLAVVAERANDLTTAEDAFRRASVITRTLFDANHPSVTTTARNLREFCEAHGIPYEMPAAATPAVALPRSPLAAVRSRPVLVAFATLAAVAAAATLVWWLVIRPEEPAADVPAAPSSAATDPVPPAEQVPTPASTPGPAPLPASKATKPSSPPPAATPVAASGSSAVSVVTARVCRDFSTGGSGEWRCTPVTDATSEGPLVFYTRVKATDSTTIEHRWYRGDDLIQRVSLRVTANTGAGYRTFSRNTVSRERAGNWRVELRAPDGAVLHEQSFIVQ